jgi:hypothetical protein
MASSMRDAADKATWSQMAKRWLAYAEYYEDRRSAFGTRAETRHRRTDSRWAQISTSDLPTDNNKTMAGACIHTWRARGVRQYQEGAASYLLPC